MPGRGLDTEGFIKREGALTQVPPAFAPVVAGARTVITDAFGPERLHSAYLYGSIPRGTAVTGVSDVDLLLVLRDEPAAGDRDAAVGCEHALDAQFAQVNGVGIELASVATILSDLERHDFIGKGSCPRAPPGELNPHLDLPARP